MPRLPQVLIKHPIAGETVSVIHSRLDDVFEELLKQLQARPTPPGDSSLDAQNDNRMSAAIV